MKKAIIAAILTASSAAHALPITYGSDQCGSIPLPGVNSQDLRIECLGYTPFDPANPTKSGIASIIRVNSTVPAQTQNDVSVVGIAQTNAIGVTDSTYNVGVQGVAETDGQNIGNRGVKGEAYALPNGAGNDIIAGQFLAGGSKSIDPARPHKIVGAQIKAIGDKPNAQIADAALELTKDKTGQFREGFLMDGNSTIYDPEQLRRRVYVKGAGVCDQFRPNVNAAWR